MSWLSPVELSGAHCALRPLAREHLPGLTEAAREGDLWKIWYTNVPAPDAVDAEIERRLGLQAQGSMLPFTSFDADGRIAGMTTYMNVDAVNKRVEIGSTWTAVRMQRSPFNTECKLLLLGHAFEQLGCIAVEFRTHFFNQQSRRAIERLGAKLDGVVRNHGRAANGTLRDTVVYSIVESEWPTVKTHLRWQLDKPR
jgi:RimJ/RimL family protein N-acetyltransferase